MKLLRDSFEQLKYRLGRILTVLDFKKYGSVDVSKYFEKFGSYYAFLVKYYPDEYSVRLSVPEASIVEFISKKQSDKSVPKRRGTQEIQRLCADQKDRGRISA